ncbi:MAG: NTP transferase domain-containing protein, partial [Desulfosarcina sp.]|nr:NTP transferase domain-containing protein [Desulfobacterales bacterium]
MKAMILAAGFGTRLLPFTENIPKPLFTIAQKPLLDITIRNLQKAGCDAIIINT